MNTTKIVLFAVLLSLAIAIPACQSTAIYRKPRSPVVVKQTGPPPHAPAHGYRAKYRYHYYPSAQVYFDTDRRIYFYLEGQDWRAGASLPQHLAVRLGAPVTLQLDTDKPYSAHSRHQRQYPPGKSPKMHKSKPQKHKKMKVVKS